MRGYIIITYVVIIMGDVMSIRKKRFFKKKIKKIKKNKFFSYKNENRIKRNFTYKNFAKSDSYNTRFTSSNFSFVNFEKATMKYCGFNGAVFNGTEFKNSNFRGSRFIGAEFKNVIFYNTKLDKANFKNATFENVMFISTSLKYVKGINENIQGIQIIKSAPKVDINNDLEKVVNQAQKNTYIKNSQTLRFKKKDKINFINIKRLQDEFNEDELLLGLSEAKELINNDFYTLSYLSKIIRKVIRKNSGF